jgi:hypothetical protein
MCATYSVFEKQKKCKFIENTLKRKINQIQYNTTNEMESSFYYSKNITMSLQVSKGKLQGNERNPKSSLLVIFSYFSSLYHCKMKQKR